MSDSVRARREAILGAAGAELARGRVRRQRHARIAATACIAAVGAVALLAVDRFREGAAPRTRAMPELAVDFASVGAEPLALDFAPQGTGALALDFAVEPAVGAPVGRPATERPLELVADGELREALQECGYCVSILRLDGQAMLVDCSTGLPQVIR